MLSLPLRCAARGAARAVFCGTLAMLRGRRPSTERAPALAARRPDTNRRARNRTEAERTTQKRGVAPNETSRVKRVDYGLVTAVYWIPLVAHYSICRIMHNQPLNLSKKRKHGPNVNERTMVALFEEVKAEHCG